MSGIYVHIPYCKVKCHYCDFHFSTNTSSSVQMVDAICTEIIVRKDYLKKEEVDTLYFGGGTPSILSNDQLGRIFMTVRENFQLAPDCEVTLECNPDDLSEEKLQQFLVLGVNRLSIGIQSFDQEVLTMMNRAHSATEAIESVLLARKMGFTNVTCDLIYGLPGYDISYWEKQLETIVDLDIPHISSYCLTIEKNTVFGHKYKQGELQLPEDELTLEQFQIMRQKLMDAGYLHYEISNFAKEGHFSQHNSSYWLGKHYLGVGPSAHSYNGDTRGWNVANNMIYIKKLEKGQSVLEIELLTEKDKCNDYVLTRLRTIWGMNLYEWEVLGENLDLSEAKQHLQEHMELQNVVLVGGVVRLTEHGMFIADKIASDLFV